MDELNQILKNAGLKPLNEGTWSVPDTVESATKLAQIMQQPIAAKGASSILYDLMGDDELFDSIAEIEDENPNEDVRPSIAIKLERWLTTNWDSPWEPEAINIIRNIVNKYTSDQPIPSEDISNVNEYIQKYEDFKNLYETKGWSSPGPWSQPARGELGTEKVDMAKYGKVTRRFFQSFVRNNELRKRLDHRPDLLGDPQPVQIYYPKDNPDDIWAIADSSGSHTAGQTYWIRRDQYVESIQSEGFGVGTFDPRSNKTADVGPDTLRKNAAKFGSKVSKGGVPPRISKDSYKHKA